MASLFDWMGAGYFKNQREIDQGKQFGSLIDEYSKPQWQQQDPLLMQQGPTQTPMVEGRKGLLDPQTQQQFALRAATIPGYQEYGQQVIGDWGANTRQGMVNDAAMQRHMIESGNNYADRLEGRPLMEAKIGTEGTRQQSNRASAYNSYMSGDNTANTMRENQQLFPSRLNDSVNQALLSQNDLTKSKGPLINQLKPHEQIPMLRELDATTDSIATLRDIQTKVQGAGIGASPSDRALMRAEYIKAALPIMQKPMNMGVLGTDERKWMIDIIGDPTSWANLTDTDYKRAMTNIDQMVAQETRNYERVMGQPMEQRSSYMSTRLDDPRTVTKPVGTLNRVGSYGRPQ